jgi:hypothetical protein
MKGTARTTPISDMTEDQATAEAVRRWGPTGAIRLRSAAGALGSVKRGRLAPYRCIVGDGRLGKSRTVEGQGDTWREAFLDAKPIATVAPSEKQARVTV